MLNVYIREDSVCHFALPVVYDVEAEFLKIEVKDTEINRKLIEWIDKGKYHDTEGFIDRYGYKLYLSDLSTGCKAALCVANESDKVIDLVECGANARDIIINVCTSGNILFPLRELAVCKYGNGKIACRIDGKDFFDLNQFNYYCLKERGLSCFV